MSLATATLTVPVSAADHAQGDPGAPATLVEYGDYQCPYCREAYPEIKRLQSRLGDELRFVFRNFPLTQAHPLARPAAELAEAADAQGSFWPMHDWLYENQTSWSQRGVPGLMEGVPALALDEAAIGAALRDPAVDQRIRRDFLGGVRSGVNGTPSFYVNGYFVQNNPALLRRAIARATGR